MTVIDGFVASAASFMLLGGAERRASSRSFLLVHQLRGTFEGKYCDFVDEAETRVL